MKQRTNRTPEQIIADLEARITSIKTREQRRAARKNPATQQLMIALKAIDKSLASGADASLKVALQEARTVLGEAVATAGVATPSAPAPAKRRGRQGAP